MTQLAGTGTLADAQRELGISQPMLYRLSKQPWFPQPVTVLDGIKLYDIRAIALAMGVPLLNRDRYEP